MHRKFLIAAVVLSGLAVAAGAFGAHVLQRITSDNKIIQGYQTAVQYMGWHAMAVLIIAILMNGDFHRQWLKRAGYCMLAGIFLFSGSLFAITSLKIQGSGLTKAIGPVTPAGGLLLITGWLFLLFALLKKNKS